MSIDGNDSFEMCSSIKVFLFLGLGGFFVFREFLLEIDDFMLVFIDFTGEMLKLSNMVRHQCLLSLFNSPLRGNLVV